MSDIPWDELMDAAGDSDFAPIPAGDYDVKITKTEATKSSTDKPMWKITAEVLSGPHAARLLFTNQTLTTDNPNALNIFFRQMAAAGLTGEFFRMKPSNQQIADALLGRTFRARVAIKEYNGSPRNEVKAWNPPSSSSMAGGPPPAAGGGVGGPPPPPAARPATAPPPPPPASSGLPQATGPGQPASAPPAASAPPPPPAGPATPDPTRDGPAIGQPQEQPAAAAASATDPGAWVVQQRAAASSEPPPF